MRIFKITVVLCSLYMLGACNTVSKSRYEEVLYEYEELRQTVTETQKAYVQQAEQVDDILMSLSKISGKTAAMRLNVENGTGKLTQVERIQDNIDSIRERIESLEEAVDENSALKKVISGLKLVVEEKEQEIDLLKTRIKEQSKKIQEQGETIVEQSGTINAQYQTILSQKKSLEQALKNQAVMLYNAGVSFEALGDDSPEIKGKKNKMKVGNLTKEMYENALKYYSEAYSAGYAEAGNRIDVVQRKLSSL